MSERHLVGTDQDPVPMCNAFVKSIVVLFLALYRVYQVYGTAVFRQPCGNRRSQKVSYIRKGFYVHLDRDSNPIPLARQPHV